MPRDGLWLLHLCALAEACVLIGDERRGRLLYELLLPHGDRNAVSYTQQPFGPVALRLGMLAAMSEQWEDAERHFASARERCEALGARGILPRVLYEHARMLVARAGAGDEQLAAAHLEEAAALSEELGLSGLLERIVALRVTRAGGRDAGLGPLPAGGRDLDDRLRGRDVQAAGRQGTPLHRAPARLARPRDPRGRARTGGRRSVRARQTPTVRSGPALDAQAKDAYRRRLEELGEELEEARGWGDPERVARAEAEIDALTEQLAQAFGLGGRDRARRITRRAGPRQRDEGDQIGDQDDRASLPRSREAPHRFDPHRPVLLVRTAGRAAAALAALNRRASTPAAQVFHALLRPRGAKRQRKRGPA